MSFTGKSIYSCGSMILEGAEDVSDIVKIISPYEAPLLDYLGDAKRLATADRHEWDGGSNWVARFVEEVHVPAISADHDEELDYQKQEAVQRLLRCLEYAVVRGDGRMRGILSMIQTNVFRPDDNWPIFPDDRQLTEKQLKTLIRHILDQQDRRLDTIVVSRYQKRLINSFIVLGPQGKPNTSYAKVTKAYEIDGDSLCVILCRSVPADTVLLLDSTKIDVVPKVDASFRYRKHSKTSGDIVGEYTLELRDESAHGMITGLAH